MICFVNFFKNFFGVEIKCCWIVLLVFDKWVGYEEFSVKGSLGL